MMWTERTVTRDGTRLTCRDEDSHHPGSATPVVLLHGLAGHAGEWDAAAAHRAPHHRVVAVDQRGHGAGERRPADVSRAAARGRLVPALRAPGDGRGHHRGGARCWHPRLVAAVARGPVSHPAGHRGEGHRPARGVHPDARRGPRGRPVHGDDGGLRPGGRTRRPPGPARRRALPAVCVPHGVPDRTRSGGSSRPAPRPRLPCRRDHRDHRDRPRIP
ncbi:MULTISPECIES: alpha/beta fold hydrolase [unclassified Streptomyces]|uniref:alpha/beta fold hydrolase n=1 Tax=unclassified Streptomyces TaxID=2593676 RepID=UPI002B1CF44D|nr:MULTISPECIES: alpha/beta fold hydrolase [unclassified Streptomyces]